MSESNEDRHRKLRSIFKGFFARSAGVKESELCEHWYNYYQGECPARCAKSQQMKKRP